MAGFSRFERLKQQRDFDLLFTGGRRLQGRLCRLRYRGNGLPRHRLGIMVSRRHGNAVWRNRVKRWYREAFRCHKHLLPLPGFDLLIQPSLSRALDGRAVRDEIQELFSLLRDRGSGGESPSR